MSEITHTKFVKQDLTGEKSVRLFFDCPCSVGEFFEIYNEYDDDNTSIVGKISKITTLLIQKGNQWEGPKTKIIKKIEVE